MKILFLLLLSSLLCAANPLRELGVYEERPPNFSPKFEVSACYASYQDEYILLQRNDDGTLGVPGGKKSLDETKEDANEREFFEETGVRLIKERMRFLKTVFISDPKEDFIFHIFVYEFEHRPEITINPKEHQAHTWKTLEKAIEMSLIWGEKEIFEECISNTLPYIIYSQMRWFKQFGFVNLERMYTSYW